MHHKIHSEIGYHHQRGGNPAIPACVNKLTPNDRLDLGYAMISSSVTIAKILFGDIHAGTE